MYGMEGIKVVGKYEFTTSYVSVECGFVQILSVNDMPLGTDMETMTTFNMSSMENPKIGRAHV